MLSRNKIVLSVFACVKNNRMYQKKYEYLVAQIIEIPNAG